MLDGLERVEGGVMGGFYGVSADYHKVRRHRPSISHEVRRGDDTSSPPPGSIVTT